MLRLKKEIDLMYDELELQYNNFGLTQLENQVKHERQTLQAVFDTTRAEALRRVSLQKIVKAKEAKANVV